MPFCFLYTHIYTFGKLFPPSPMRSWFPSECSQELALAWITVKGNNWMLWIGPLANGIWKVFILYLTFFVRPVEEKLIFSVRMPAKTLSSLLAAPNHSTLLCNHWYLFPFSSPLLLNHISSKFVWTDVCLACQWTDRPHQQTRLNPKVKSLVGLRV